jgi:hypothetical protein
MDLQTTDQPPLANVRLRPFENRVRTISLLPSGQRGAVARSATRRITSAYGRARKDAQPGARGRGETLEGARRGLDRSAPRGGRSRPLVLPMALAARASCHPALTVRFDQGEARANSASTAWYTARNSGLSARLGGFPHRNVLPLVSPPWLGGAPAHPNGRIDPIPITEYTRSGRRPVLPVWRIAGNSRGRNQTNPSSRPKSKS